MGTVYEGKDIFVTEGGADEFTVQVYKADVGVDLGAEGVAHRTYMAKTGTYVATEYDETVGWEPELDEFAVSKTLIGWI
jgi:hypothetical protein